MVLKLFIITNERKLQLFVNVVLSYEAILNAGMPQGSILGPLLFLLFTNDIVDDLIGMARLFANDTSLSFSSAQYNNNNRSSHKNAPNA